MNTLRILFIVLHTVVLIAMMVLAWRIYDVAEAKTTCNPISKLL